ncbi:hypothetical protein GWI33_019857 [Rhynchophorus ferrugineus]|uniref:Platelet-derived growth factor (PDGF) family profile domain-containing protein n=1 Tax=Rhynchophorus ferrugineus TaxID=354439 RepID=A0A834HRU3_RHYFE|nr:hypothetical protein GWI33_019857 [Rhynchophorus ferrugineus]
MFSQLIEEFKNILQYLNLIFRKYDPPSVILHRCGGSGCCLNKNERCIHSKHEKLYLEIAYLPDPDYMKKTYLVATNHTACECVAKNV